MPLELGLFLGAKLFGGKKHKQKSCLILDKERYRYQKYISDIAGQDIQAHNNCYKNIIQVTRDWLSSKSCSIIPGGEKMFERYKLFQDELPAICKSLHLEIPDLTYDDYIKLIRNWAIDNKI